MFNKEEYRKRREAGKRGQGDSPQTATLLRPSDLKTVDIKGEQVYIPRKNRRAITRKFLTDIRKGRIDLAELNRERIKRNRDRTE